jgi:hypothetical protein
MAAWCVNNGPENFLDGFGRQRAAVGRVEPVQDLPFPVGGVDFLVPLGLHPADLLGVAGPLVEQPQQLLVDLVYPVAIPGQIFSVRFRFLVFFHG